MFIIIKEYLSELLSELKIDIGAIDISYPPNYAMGDYTTNIALKYAHSVNKNPIEMAQNFCKKLASHAKFNAIFSHVEVAAPGFINFYLKKDFVHLLLKEVYSQHENFGRLNRGKGKNVIIEYSSPNIAKQMHVGHLRSTIIGKALCNIYDYLGYHVIGDNHLGDWGRQFGILIAAYKEKYHEKIIKNIGIDEMENLYVDYNKRMERDDKLKDRARAELKLLQDNNKFNIYLWKLFRARSLEELESQIYTPLKVVFDTMYGESFFYNIPSIKKIYYNEVPSVYVNDIVNMALRQGVAIHSEGAIIIPLGNINNIPLLIQKGDGAYLYATSDLAAIKFRQDKYRPDIVLYVVGQQDLHFQQVFESAEKLGLIQNKNKWQHISFGTVLGEDGKKMSTREGNVVSAQKLIQKSIDSAYEVVEKKNSDMPDFEKRKISRMVGIGALKYNDLSRDRTTNITFDWKNMMRISTGSASYLQYTYARIQSILSRKKDFKRNGPNPNFANLTHRLELKIGKYILRFPEVLLETAKLNKPNVLTQYLEELASSFQLFYENVSVLQSEKNLRFARLALIEIVGNVIKRGLNLLEIDVLKKM